jgi:glycosyltransferase involved in cell wall biosynthesis
MPEASQLKVSVLIPTRNRAKLLQELIESLWTQTLPATQYEIIVVDNCSRDETAAILEQMARRSPCRMRYVIMDENRGPVHTRNLAAKMADAEILAFTDSDCRVSMSWLENGLRIFESSPQVALVSGPVVDKPEQPVRFFTLRNGAGAGENYTYPTCNVFYRKSVFFELGGFDESVWLADFFNSPIECSDTDLAWRLKESGFQNVYSEEVLVYHEVARVTPAAWLVYHTRLLVIPELVRRHPQLREKLLLGRLFFCQDNILFYLLVAGLVAAAIAGPWWLLLAAPYLGWVASIRGKASSLSLLVRIPARIPVFVARHLVVCASLLYGSIRSRTLVL